MRKLFICMCEMDAVSYLPNGMNTELFNDPLYEHSFRKIMDCANKIGIDVKFVRASACGLHGTVNEYSAEMDDIIAFTSPLLFLAKGKDIESALEQVIKNEDSYVTLGNQRNMYMAVGQGRLIAGSSIGSCSEFVTAVSSNGFIAEHVAIADGEKCAPPTKLEYLRRVERYREEFIDYLVMSGVEIQARDGIVIGPTCEIHKGVKILPNTQIYAWSKVYENSEIGPNTSITATEVGEFCQISGATVNGCTIDDNVQIFPGAYIADCQLGDGCVIGSGVVTVNMEGKKKQMCKIGKTTVVGANTCLVAPLTIGEGALIACGSTITDDVPTGALAIAREYQSNHEGFAKRRGKNGKHI